MAHIYRTHNLPFVYHFQRPLNPHPLSTPLSSTKCRDSPTTEQNARVPLDQNNPRAIPSSILFLLSHAPHSLPHCHRAPHHRHGALHPPPPTRHGKDHTRGSSTTLNTTRTWHPPLDGFPNSCVAHLFFANDCPTFSPATLT